MSFRTNFSYLEGKLFTYEERNTPTGKTVSKITLLVANGPEKSAFVPVEAWQLQDKLRQLLNSNAGKCRIAVQGELEMESWEDKQTKAKRSRLKLVARQVFYLGLAQARENGDEAPKSTYRAAPKASTPKAAEPVEPEAPAEDTPF